MEGCVRLAQERIVCNATIMANAHNAHQVTHEWRTTHANSVAQTADHATPPQSANVTHRAIQPHIF